MENEKFVTFKGRKAGITVVLDKEARYDGLNDSKKLTEKQRERLYDEIVKSCIAYSVVMVDNETIDEINILQATLLGMKRAIEALAVDPDIALIDGNIAPQSDVACKAVIKGDSHSACIAAASVLAKVTRDRHMAQLNAQYPEYGFARHKGYPTKYHFQMIEQHGITPVHRKTFLKEPVEL